MISLDELLGLPAPLVENTRTLGEGPAGALPIDADFLMNRPSGDLFGLTQNVGMGWNPAEMLRKQMLILSTQGGLREPDGRPTALGFHTGHWEIGLLVKAAAEELRALKLLPFSATCSDPCDGRTQGTTGMFDSLPYRNDAAIVMRRLIRSLPTCSGVMGIATCDKGLPAMMMALAGVSKLPSILVPGGVTLPARDAEDAGTVQTLGARFSHGMVNLQEAAERGCRACGSAGGGCQFLGTAATSQVVGEALGMSLPHTALIPSGEPIWLAMAKASAQALNQLEKSKTSLNKILTGEAIHNAMVVHAAFGGSTNLLLHIPAIAHAAGIKPPTVQDWIRINRAVPRLVSVLPNGPVYYPTVFAFMAGGVPEVMLYLRELGLLQTGVLTVTGRTLDENLEWWKSSERRKSLHKLLKERDGIDPSDVIMSPEKAKAKGLTSTVTFPTGNIAPEGAVIKSTAIDPAVVGADGVYRIEGPAKVFTSEREAILAIKNKQIESGDIMVLIGGGPCGTGMEETYQVTSALKHLPFGKHVALVTDARFSGVSTGACIGHVGPEALAGGPIGRIQNGDVIRIVVDRNNNLGSLDLVGVKEGPLDSKQAEELLKSREMFPGLKPHPLLPDDTRLWAALQQASGGSWAGCVYDADKIITILEAGQAAMAKQKAESLQK
ncbi:MAG: dehydratase [Verrucomicrobiales bacterium]|jgi:putative YjhG/YagF family dehydratase|nr:dehydratase [Verrucomicrobiales bacterium]